MLALPRVAAVAVVAIVSLLAATAPGVSGQSWDSNKYFSTCDGYYAACKTYCGNPSTAPTMTCQTDLARCFLKPQPCTEPQNYGSCSCPGGNPGTSTTTTTITTSAPSTTASPPPAAAKTAPPPAAAKTGGFATCPEAQAACVAQCATKGGVFVNDCSSSTSAGGNIVQANCVCKTPGGSAGGMRAASMLWYLAAIVVAILCIQARPLL